MFVTLPLFLSFGFLIGYGLKKESQYAWRGTLFLFGSADAAIASFLFVAAAYVLADHYLAKYVSELTEHRFMIALGGVAVGIATGLWFVKAKDDNSADAFKFVAGAVIVVMLSAVQYDTNIFNRLSERVSKFGAVGVSVELTPGEGKPSEEAPGRNSADILEDNRARWKGAERLDYVILSLRWLGDREIRDEQLARIFASIDTAGTSEVDLPDAYPAMTSLARRYIRYACGPVYRLAGQFGVTQDVLRGEVVSSPDLETLINHLKIFYFQALVGDPKAVAPDLDKDVAALEARSKAENQALGLQPQPPDENLCKDMAETADEFPTELAIGPDDFHGRGYLALTLALLEAATGNQEGAVQLLDRERARQQADFIAAGDVSSPAEKACSALQRAAPANREDCERSARLNAYRRLTLIARLENTQDGIMDSWRTTAIAPARLRTLQRAVDHFGLAFTLLRPNDVKDFAIFRRASGSDAAERCLATKTGDAATRKAVARWALIRATSMANALDSASSAPDLVHEDEALRRTLDGYAEYIAAFDTDCVKSNGLDSLDAELPRVLVKYVAEYWEMRARIQTVKPDEEDRHNSAKLSILCKSRDGYARALKMYEDAELSALQENSDTTPKKKALPKCKLGQRATEPCAVPESELDGMQGRLHDKIEKHRVEEAKDRIKRILAHGFPEAEVEKYCPSDATQRL